MVSAEAQDVAVDNTEARQAELAAALDESELQEEEYSELLIEAWEAAVETALEDRVIALGEERALGEYMAHFGLSVADVNANGAYTSVVQSAAIRDVTEGIIPRRQNIDIRLPFNLMKSEEMVWVLTDVDYLEVVTRRERRGASQGLSIRIARGVYYRPSSFRSRTVEWEETKKVDRGLLGLTTKHLYFAGEKRKFRVRYDRIVTFEPYDDGLGIMRDAQTAKPQSFVTGDGWFVYNLAVNLAEM